MTHSTTIPVIPASARRRFGRTELLVSPLGFGGAPIGNLDTDAADVRRILDLLIDHGVNLIDTAHAYHGSEAAIGPVMERRRDEVVLVTKCGSKWTDDDLPPAWTPAYIRATIDRSLRRLRTDRVDVCLLHSCDLATLEKGEALGAVLEARDAGKVRFAGYSGDNEAAAWAAAQDDVAVVQTSISVCDQKNICMVLPVAAAHDVGVLAKRPVANGAWKPLASQYEKYKKYEAPYRERFAAMDLDLNRVRDACGESIDWPQIMLRFTLSFPASHTAIVGTTKLASAEANLAAAAKGPLPGEAVALLRAAFDAADPNGAWSGLT